MVFLSVGSRAANGVIMITTKRGSEGRSVVNFKATLGLQSRSIKDYDMVNQNEFVQLTWEALKNNYYLNGGYSLEEAKLLASKNMSASLGGEFYNPYKNYAWDQVIDPETGLVRADANPAWNESWMDVLTNKKALRQEYQLGVSGGDRKTKHAFSFGYLDDNGVLITTGFKRYSIRANVDHTVNDWMQLGASASYAYTIQNSSQYSNTQTGNAWYTQFDYGENNRPKASRFNVVGDLKDNIYETMRDNTSIRAYATLGGDNDVMGVFKGLSLSTNFGADIDGRYITSYYNPYHGDGSSVGGEVDKYSTRSFSYTWNQILKYERTFNDFHALAQVGHEYYNYNYKYLYAERTGVYPGIIELAPATNVTGNNSYSDVYRMESFFSRLAADYKDKYYLEATWRTDGSSRFYQDNRWGQFWSLGASWRLSQENFMKSIPWIDNLTVRLSYGQLGNDSIGSYYAWQSFYDLTYPNASNAGAVVSSLANPAVSWEKKGTWNTGFEGTFFNQLLNLTVEYYNSLTSDMLLSFPMPTSTGFNGYNANVGSMRNQGVEGTIRLNWLKSGNVRASSTLMGYFNRNKVDQLQEGVRASAHTGWGSTMRVPFYDYIVMEDESVGLIQGMQSAGFYSVDDFDVVNGVWTLKAGVPDNEIGMGVYSSPYKLPDGQKAFPGMVKYADTDGNGTIDANDATIIGHSMPKHTGGFNLSGRWKGLDFAANFTYQIGGDIYNANVMSDMMGNKDKSLGYNRRCCHRSRCRP